jgi:hypothetical protein
METQTGGIRSQTPLLQLVNTLATQTLMFALPHPDSREGPAVEGREEAAGQNLMHVIIRLITVTPAPQQIKQGLAAAGVVQYLMIIVTLLHMVAVAVVEQT